MALPTIGYTLDDIHTTTLQKIRPKIADAIFDANVFLDWLRSRGRVTVETGGKWIEQRLKYAKNNTVASYEGYGEMAAFPTESLTGAVYNWREYSGAIMISGREKAINSGEAQQISLWKHQIDLLEMSFRDVMGTHVLAADAAKNPAKDILGLPQIIVPTVSNSQGALGGITRTTTAQPWWMNQFNSFDYSTDVSTIANPLWYRMTNMLYETQQQLIPSRDMALLTNQATMEKFELENHGKFRLTQADMHPLNIGAGELQFKGLRLMWDPRVSVVSFGGSDYNPIYYINSSALNFTVHQNVNFTWMEPQTPVKQNATVRYMLFMGQLTSANNRHHGLLLWKE